jgi:hypothetical protein
MQQQKQPCHRLERLAQLSLSRVKTKFKGEIKVPKRLKRDAVDAALFKIIEYAHENGIDYEDETHDGLLVDVGAGEIANFVRLHENTRNSQFQDVIPEDKGQGTKADHSMEYGFRPSNQSANVEDDSFDSPFSLDEFEITERCASHFNTVGQEVIHLWLMGCSQREIADELRINRNKVRAIIVEFNRLVEELKRD